MIPPEEGEEVLDPEFRPAEYIEDHTFKIDYAVVIYEGMACGYTEDQIARMRYAKWHALSKVYRDRYNMSVKKMIFAEKPKVESALSL